MHKNIPQLGEKGEENVGTFSLGKTLRVEEPDLVFLILDMKKNSSTLPETSDVSLYSFVDKSEVQTNKLLTNPIFKPLHCLHNSFFFFGQNNIGTSTERNVRKPHIREVLIQTNLEPRKVLPSQK